MTNLNQRPLPTRIAFVFLWLFVFTLPLAQATEIPWVGTITKVAGLIAMAAGGVAVLARRQVRALATVHMTMAGFIVWSAITLCWSIAPELTVQQIMTYVQLFVLAMLVWEFCVEEKDILRILGAFVLGTMVPALSTLRGFLPAQDTFLQRASVAGYDPNTLPMILAISLPVSYYLILREKSAVTALYRLQMGFAVCAVLLSGSAATMVAMAVGLSLACWTIHAVPARTRNNAFALVVLFSLAGMLLLPASLWKHISEESRKGGITLTTAVNSGLESMHSTPAGGFGAGSMAAAAGHSAATAKTSFTMLSETGVVGVACFIVLLAVLFLSAERMTGITKSFWCTVLGVWVVGVCSLNWECSQASWLLFGLLAAHSACLKQEGVTPAEREQKLNYYVERSAEVWS
jgi:hypothetical protein